MRYDCNLLPRWLPAVVGICGAMTLASCATTGAGSSEISIARSAQEQEIWSRTYAVVDEFNRSLNARAGDSSSVLLARHLNVEPQTARRLVVYALNYGTSGISAARVLKRYPHYAAAPVRGDLQDLLQRGWLREDGDSETYALTASGLGAIDRYFELERRRVALIPDGALGAVSTLAITLAIVAGEAAALQENLDDSSIGWRMTSPRAPPGGPPYLMLMQAFGDLIAFVNDTAHDRFGRLARIEGTRVALSPLAQELLASMRRGRQYAAQQCVEHPIWRIDEQTCLGALAELVAAGLAERTESQGVRQTPRGAAYFESAEKWTDLELYRPWRALAPDAYGRFVTALDQLAGGDFRH